jgi:hypothetical protein
LPKVIRGVTFRDGVEVTDTPAQTPPDQTVTQIPA